MSATAIRDWVVEWFIARGVAVAGQFDANVFELGFIDSFGVVELIEAAESQFAMRFSESDFQDRRFPTITGLAAIIAERQNPETP